MAGTPSLYAYCLLRLYWRNSRMNFHSWYAGISTNGNRKTKNACIPFRISNTAILKGGKNHINLVFSFAIKPLFKALKSSCFNGTFLGILFKNCLEVSSVSVGWAEDISL